MTKHKIIRRDTAKQDIVEIADYLAIERSAEIAESFLCAVEDSFELLLSMPDMSSRRHYLNPALSDLRMWPIKNFDRILIFYRRHSEGLEIVRIIHSARDILQIFEDGSLDSVQ